MTTTRKLTSRSNQPTRLRFSTGPRARASVSPRAGPWITGEVLTDRHH
jgi:hypothetical protein